LQFLKYIFWSTKCYISGASGGTFSLSYTYKYFYYWFHKAINLLSKMQTTSTTTWSSLKSKKNGTGAHLRAVRGPPGSSWNIAFCGPKNVLTIMKKYKHTCRCIFDVVQCYGYYTIVLNFGTGEKLKMRHSLHLIKTFFVCTGVTTTWLSLTVDNLGVDEAIKNSWFFSFLAEKSMEVFVSNECLIFSFSPVPKFKTIV
jgi:hypothetical protein